MLTELQKDKLNTFLLNTDGTEFGRMHNPDVARSVGPYLSARAELAMAIGFDKQTLCTDAMAPHPMNQLEPAPGGVDALTVQAALSSPTYRARFLRPGDTPRYMLNIRRFRCETDFKLEFLLTLSRACYYDPAKVWFLDLCRALYPMHMTNDNVKNMLLSPHTLSGLMAALLPGQSSLIDNKISQHLGDILSTHHVLAYDDHVIFTLSSAAMSGTGRSSCEMNGISYFVEHFDEAILRVKPLAYILQKKNPDGSKSVETLKVNLLADDSLGIGRS